MAFGSVLASIRGNDAVRQFTSNVPIARNVVDRFIGGEELADAMAKAIALADDGYHVCLAPIDHQRTTITAAINQLKAAGLEHTAELSIRMSELGASTRERRQAVHAIAEEAAPLAVTLEAEGDPTEELSVVLDNLAAFPHLGLTIAANQRRAEADCKELAKTAARVRLVKGAFATSKESAYPNGPELDKAFVRCLKVLMAGSCHPLVATHDDRLLEIAIALATRNQRKQGTYEFEFYLGVNPKLAERLVNAGDDVRMYIPYGEGWYQHLLGRLVIRPASLGLLWKGITS